MNQPAAEHGDHQTDGDVTRLQLGDAELLLVGTAHISQESVETVRRVIADEEPDVVAVELDAERYKSMRSEVNWEDLDLLQIIRNKQLTFLLARLALASFQKRMGGFTGVKPGAELQAAIEAAEKSEYQVELIDRNIRTTLLRAWRGTPWWRRAELIAALGLGVFQKSEVDEEQLAEMREMANLSMILDELGEEMPDVKQVLVDERDAFMAYRLANIEAKKIVAVVGAAHKPGILRQIRQPITAEEHDAIDTVPPKGSFGKIFSWALPTIIIGLFIWGFFNADPTNFKNAALAWVLANGGLSALGAMIALAHPVTIIVAFLAAPITSLNPTVGAGMVTAFVQTVIAAPKVRDFQTIGDDIASWKGWWKNRLGRVLLVFIFSSLGSSLGTFVALGWLKNLI